MPLLPTHHTWGVSFATPQARALGMHFLASPRIQQIWHHGTAEEDYTDYVLNHMPPGPEQTQAMEDFANLPMPPLYHYLWLAQHPTFPTVQLHTTTLRDRSDAFTAARRRHAGTMAQRTTPSQDSTQPDAPAPLPTTLAPQLLPTPATNAAADAAAYYDYYQQPVTDYAAELPNPKRSRRTWDSTCTTAWDRLYLR